MIKKILIIRFSSLGDIVLTEPIVRFIHQEFPEAEIDYLTKASFKSLIDNFNHINKIYIWQDKIQLIKQLRKNNYDLVLDLHVKLNSIIVKNLIMAKRVYSYNKKHFLRKMIVHKLSQQSIFSTLNLYFSIFKKINPDIYEEFSASNFLSEDAYPKFHIEEKLRPEIFEIFENFQINPGKTLIGIFPGASYNTKQYPLDYWIEFLNMIPEAWNCQFIILGSFEEKYQAIKIRNACEIKPVDLCAYFDLKKLLVFMSYLQGFISNDSGPMHLAAALEKPQIALFGATHTKLGFKPLNKHAVILQANLRCQPCSLHGGDDCPKKHFKCFRSLKAHQLMEEFKKMLEKKIWKL